ncbi:uncharacterized protein METZ01_LOCUS359164, partial [marine metagenome]
MVARYADAVNRYDEALWAGTWTVNSVWDLAGMEVEGRKGVVDFWRNAWGASSSPYNWFPRVPSK